MSKEVKESPSVVPISMEDLEFVVPENLLKVVSMMDPGSELNFPSTQLSKTRRISVDKDFNGNVRFSVHAGNFQVMPKGLKCVIKDLTNTANFNANGRGDSILIKQISTRDAVDNEENIPLGPSSVENEHLGIDAFDDGQKSHEIQTESGMFLSPLRHSDSETLGIDSEKSNISKHKLSNIVQIVHDHYESLELAKNKENSMFPENEITDTNLLCLHQALEETSKNISELSTNSSKGVDEDGGNVDKSEVKIEKFSIESNSSMRLRPRNSCQKAKASEEDIEGEDSFPHVQDGKKEVENENSQTQEMEDKDWDSGTSSPRKNKRYLHLPRRPDLSREKNIQCRLCNRWVKTYVILYSHVQKLHALHPEMQSYRDEIKKLKQVTCEICHKTLSQENELKIHLKNVHGDKESGRDHTCTECNKRFWDVKYLRTHIERVHPKTRVLCHLCPATFKTKTYLQEHIDAIHEKKVAYVCGQCGKNFVARSSWVRHKAYHDNTKYNCLHCGRGFTEKANMVRHVRSIHELGNSRKVNCEHCGKGFSSSGNLKQHVRTVHLKEFTFKCGVCGKGFLRNKLLQEHLEYHHTVDHLKSETESSCVFESSSVMSVKSGLGHGTIEPLGLSSVTNQHETNSAVGKQNAENSNTESMFIVITRSDSENTGPGQSVVQVKDEAETDITEQSILQQLQMDSPSQAMQQITVRGNQVFTDCNLQQILDLAQLQQIHIQDISPDLLNLPEGVEIHIP